MIPLARTGRPHRVERRLRGKILSVAHERWPERLLMVDRWRDDLDVQGVTAVLCAEPVDAEQLARIDVPIVHDLALDHLAEGDAVAIEPAGQVRTLYRRGSPHNALFATDRCSSLCLMCSQPPRAINDDWRVQEMLDTVSLIDPDTEELGITGGEPTLLKDGFLAVLAACKEHLPTTGVHVLSNGRLFRYGSYARQVAAIQHHDLMIGVPLYSDLEDRHDHVVQAKGAFEETILGLRNLGRFGVPVEIRVVVHRFTYDRLPELAQFIYRNLTFAAQVVFMGLEMMGYAVANLDALWIDPWDYRDELERATLFLAQRRMKVSVYNHQLCTMPETIWPYCRKSISDWKNEYLPQCDACALRSSCGGFFASAVKRRVSQHIQPLQPSAVAATT